MNARVQPNQMLWKVLKKIRMKRSSREAYTCLHINKLDLLCFMRCFSWISSLFYTLFIRKENTKLFHLAEFAVKQQKKENKSI